MSQFVEECRREWKRLGVPDPVANEMAADLAADLTEAESDGASAEEVLGNAAFDPRTFAASWARERGVIQSRKRDTLRRPPLLAGIAVLLALLAAAVVAVVALVSSPSSTRAPATPTPTATGAARTTTAPAVIVPNMIGLQQDEAIRLAQEVGLGVEVRYRGSGRSAAAAVVAQSPAAGAEVLRGAVLSLVLGQ